MKRAALHFLVTFLAIVAVVSPLIIGAGGKSVSAAGLSGGDHGPEFAQARILVQFKPDVSPSEMATIHGQLGGVLQQVIPGIGTQVVSVPEGTAEEKVEAYSNNPKVKFAEVDFLGTAVGEPDDSYFSNQWGLSKVQAPLAWDVSRGNANVNIAILDTGVDYSHVDLADKVIANANFSSSATDADVYGHGTHVAGIAAASTNNSIGVAGLGYDSTIMNVKVLGDGGSGFYSWVSSGVIWAVDNGAEIINMSLGGTSYSQTLEEAVNYAWNNGVIVVAAAGNSGSSAPFYPASYENCIAVAATDGTDSLPFWSNFGDWVDVAAPGLSIYSTLIGDGYGYKSGTSMASPYVAGLAGLVLPLMVDSNGDGFINDEARNRIQSTADPVGTSGAGSGRINAYRAVTELPLPPLPAGSIAGQVTDASDGTPVQGASVLAGGISSITDVNGDYIIPDLPPEDYDVTVSKSGYDTSSRVVNVISGEESIADFAIEKTVVSLVEMWSSDISFTSKGKNLFIDVTVTGDKGRVPGADVEVLLDWNASTSWSLSGLTDSTGVARLKLSNPSSGSYTANLSGLSRSGYVWQKDKGINSAGYTLSQQGRRGKSHNK